MASAKNIEEVYEAYFKPKIGFDLKTEQLELVTKFLNRKDCLGCLPTGFGKSMIYTLAPVIMDKVNRSISRCTMVLWTLVVMRFQHNSSDSVSYRFKKEAHCYKHVQATFLPVHPSYLAHY